MARALYAVTVFAVLAAVSVRACDYCPGGLVRSCPLETSGLGGTQHSFVQNAGSGSSVTGATVSLKHGNRAYLGECLYDSWSPSLFTKVPLLDMVLTFTADVSTVGCGCNVGLYLVAMPAVGPTGSPDKSSSGDYYCDANKVSGVWCPEIDLMEANKFALQATPHRCDPPTATGYYSSCDRSGCGQNTYRNDPRAYGPGSQYTIDTTAPFNVSTAFHSVDGTLDSITTTLSQAGRTFVMNHDSATCGPTYIPSLTHVVKTGMVVVITSWGGPGSEMSWLDAPPCSASTQCNADAALVSFSRISVEETAHERR